jgi:hypothetical protein
MTGRASPLRRRDLIERDAMIAALGALDTGYLQSILDLAEEWPHHRARWHTLTVAGGVRMIADPELVRAELADRDRTAAGQALKSGSSAL